MSALMSRSAALFVALVALAHALPAHAGFSLGPSAPIDPTKFPAVRDQDQVAAADNGTVSLFVWRDTRHGDADLFAARVQHDGTVLDPNGIEIAAGPGSQGEPAVSWDGTQWLVAWTDVQGSVSEVRATRVGTAGDLLDFGPTTLSTSGAVASHPAVAWNGALHIVVWSEQVVSPATLRVMGATIDNSGAVRATVAPVSGAITDDQPAIAAAGVNALVVFRSARNLNEDIFSVRVTAALPAGTITRMSPTDVALVTLTSQQQAPAVASNGVSWLAAWQDGRSVNTTGQNVYGTRVTATGSVGDPTGIAITFASGDDGQVALTRNGSEWLATWTGASGQFARAILSNGTTPGAIVPVSNTPGVVGDGGFSGAAATPILAWSEPGPDGSLDLLGRRVNASMVLDPPFAIATQTPNQTEPAMAFGADRWFIAWVDDRYGPSERQIRIGLTDTSAFVAPNPSSIGFASPSPGLDQGHPAATWDGTNFNLFWDESRGGRRIIQGARFKPSGALLDTFTVAGDSWNQYEPTAFSYDSGSSLGGHTFIAWTDSRGGPTERDIWAVDYLHGVESSGPSAIAEVAGVREEHPAAANSQNQNSLTAYETSAPDVDRGIEAVQRWHDLGSNFPYHRIIDKIAGRTFEHPEIAQNGEDLMITYQEVVFSDGPSLHIPFARRFFGDNPNPYFFHNQIGPGSYTPANPVVGSAGYDYMVMWSTLNGGGPDVVATALEVNGSPLFPVQRLTNDTIVDTPGAAQQGLGDHVGLTYLRAMASTAWNGLQLYGGEALDTLEGKLLINEFLAHPVEGGGEFFEVFNTSGHSVLLNGWTLHIDGDTNVVADCPSDFRKGGDRQTDSGPGDIVLGTPCSEVSNQSFFTETNFFGYESDPVEGVLPDRGAVLELFSPGGVLVDRVGYGYKGGAPVSGPIASDMLLRRAGEAAVLAVPDSTPFSTARIPQAANTGSNPADFNVTTTPTPDAANTGTTSQLGTKLYVTKVNWSDPTGHDAVEFYNPSSTENFDFSNWFLSNNSSTELIGLLGNAFSILKPGEHRILRRNELGSFTFDFDAISTLYLYDPEFVRLEQLGWTREQTVTPRDSCAMRVPDTGGFHNGWDWLSSGGEINYTQGALRYAPCNIQAPSTGVDPAGARLAFAGAWPNPALGGQPAVLVFSIPGAPGGAPVRAKLSLYDVAGRRVATMVDELMTPGEHRVPLARVDRSQRVLRTGTYYADLVVGGERVRRTIVFLN